MRNELYHHGRLNQKWGVRNGPPYPLSRATVQRAYSKKRKNLLGYLAERREKKAAEKKAREEAEKKAREEAEKKAREEEQTRRIANKERALKEGSATDLLPYLNELSTKELEDAYNRIQWAQKIRAYSLNEKGKEWEAMNRTMKKVSDVKDWAQTGALLLKALDDSRKVLTGNGDQVSSGEKKKKK